MKKIFFVLLVFNFLSIFSAQSQKVVMIFSSGLSPQQSPATHFIYVNRSTPRNEFTFDLAQVKTSYFIGAGAKYDANPFFFSAEAQYNKREYVYNIAYTFPGFGRSEQSQLLTESLNVINVPLSLGVDLGAVDVTSGFLPQVILSQNTDLKNLDGYTQKLKWLRFGWHTGVAANVGDLRIGVSMQMDFNNYADHAYIRNQNLALQGRSTRMLGTLSYQF